MLHDVEFFQSRLSKIDGFGDAAEFLKGIIKAKQVKSAAPAIKAEAGDEEEEEEEEEEDSSESDTADAKGEPDKTGPE